VRPSIVAMPMKVAEPPSVVYLNDLAVLSGFINPVTP
jgi:hypothetical protein